MLKNPRIFLTLFIVLTVGCSGSAKQTPIEKQTRFPESRYLTAEGSGQTEHEARRRAMAELSGIFESRVHAETTSLARSAIGPDSNEFFEKNVESRIAVVSSVQLKGAKIGREWQTESVPVAYHALAVIDRLQAGKGWAAQLETVDAQVTAQIKNLESLQGRFQRMVALNRVLSGLIQKQALESRLRVLNYPARSTLDMDMVTISEEFVQLRSQLRFFADLSGDGAQIAMARIADALTSNGLMLTDARDQADAVISGKIETRPLELNNPKAKFVRSTAIVTVVETGTGATVATLNESIRKGHVDQSEAARRAIMQLADILADRLEAEFGFDPQFGADL